MKVVLLEDVRKVGKKGDVVNVSDGYGQNFLIKNKLAVKETAGAKKILEQQKEEARLQDIENKKNAEALKEKIGGITLEFVLKSGKDGKTFGSVSTKHIVEQLREKYDMPVIFLSAKSEDIDKIKGLNVGADDYITKPY